MPSTTDDPVMEAEHGAYQTSSYAAAGAGLMSFAPINQIHQHLCGLHLYASDPSRAVKAHHFCTHLRKNLHQCVIYDGDSPQARLIGVEYLIPEEEFLSLPEGEKKWWHSHKYEVESGMLVMGPKSLVPMTDLAERPAMLELHRTYGKTIHTWQYDIHPDLPLGPPQLMLAFTADGQVDEAQLRERDEALGVSTAAKRQLRQGYLRQEDLDRSPAEGCDEWTKGTKLSLKLEETE